MGGISSNKNQYEFKLSRFFYNFIIVMAETAIINKDK